MAEDVRDNPSAHRYEIAVDDEVKGVIEYEQRADGLALVHTEVSRDSKGSGLGQRLVLETLKQLQAQNTTVIAECPFVDSMMQKHPEYSPPTA